MKSSLFILFVFVVNLAVNGQNYSNKAVTVGETTFLPYLKGKVVNRVAINDAKHKQLFALLHSLTSVSAPQGYEVEAYSDVNNQFLAIYFIPYVLEQDETVRAKAGSSLNVFFNDITALWQPLDLNLSGIYLAPVKVGEFVGFPIYNQSGREMTMIYKGSEPLFLPVSREEYLLALIRSEEEKQKESGTPKSPKEISSEVDKVYRELLKTDKAAAEEFKKEMGDYEKDLEQNRETEDLLTSYRKELAGLSSLEKKKKAYYAVYAMEKYGTWSGLVPDGEENNATPLVKANIKAIQKSSYNIQLMTLGWDLVTPPQSEKNSPRFYHINNNFGYELADDRMCELYNNEALWKRIIELVCK